MTESKAKFIDVVCLAEIDSLSSYHYHNGRMYVTTRRVGCHFFKWMSMSKWFIKHDERLCFITTVVDR